MTRALLLVDIQHDFLPGGALGVADGDAVVPVARRLAERFDLVVASQDWHPADHGSFAANHPGRAPLEVVELHGLSQVLWPTHCVQGSRGAELVDDFGAAHVVRKGTDPTVDSYSAFFDNGRRQDTGLHAWLAAHDVEELYVMGLATDYCVKFTALDAADCGYATFVVEDGCRGVNARAGDADAALQELRDAGVRVVRSSEV